MFQAVYTAMCGACFEYLRANLLGRYDTREEALDASSKACELALELHIKSSHRELHDMMTGEFKETLAEWKDPDGRV